ncbi:hypothetical protein B5S28_g2728 [[Candida] boidinii]|nr:hypothetical protein B5S28_g2728 [[Candida] boidinii]OWB61672.1 hypothetical protein B5S29_g2572 [[Candida] boidinii]OWB72419.1 hypothetical protein B5S31_g2128 [[Candida] boidinii]OWB80529.1 hypothetical protein B5S32_g4813 [[Candida] boidinii]
MQTSQVFEDFEDKTGLRFSWNLIPNKQNELLKLSVPLACLYQPLRTMDQPILLNEPPIVCRGCQGILNPYCQPDLNTQSWTCCFCFMRNALPPHYHHQLPFSTNQDCVNVEYNLPIVSNVTPPIYIFVVDTCIDKENIESLTSTLQNSISSLPPDSIVGFISFGKNVNIHELGNFEMDTSYVFNGAKEYTVDQIEKHLNILSSDLRNNNNNNKQNGINGVGGEFPGYQFLQPLSICEFQINKIIETLIQDNFPIAKQHRAERCTGSAINIAINLLQSYFNKTGAHIIVFSGGPCTFGPGSIVSTDLKDPLRSHSDLNKDNKISKIFKKNKKFYENLSKIASLSGHTIDLFIGSYDQIGLSEMEILIDKTGGVIVQSDDFTTAIFKQSFQRFINSQIESGINATLELKLSKGLKINGLLGHGISLNTKKNNTGNSGSSEIIGDKVIGEGNTNAWKLGSINSHSTYAIYFDITDNITNNNSSNYVFFQFITHYQHCNGNKRLHVTTVTKPIMQQTNPQHGIIEFFDQECSAVIIAREAIYKVTNDNSIDAIRWCDKILVELLTRYADYRTNEVSSFKLSNFLQLFPQFMYHLRRSNFIQVFNSSPDESSFYRHVFNSEDTLNSLTMIQPSLTSFEIDNEPQVVLLDSLSIKPTRILLLDTFFHLLIFHGSQIAEWKRLGYQDMEEYEYLKEFFEKPRLEAAEILVDRFPLPRFIDTEEGGSQARFLYSKLNPTTSYKNNDIQSALAGAAVGDGAVVLTDDVSFQDFLNYVASLVVKP